MKPLLVIIPSARRYAQFTYDHAGNRVKKTTDTGTTIYLGESYEIRSTEVTKYVFLGSLRIAERRVQGENSSLYYYHTDHLQSTNVVTNSDGQVVSLFEYQPWGESSRKEIHPGLGEANATRYRFTGQEEDPEVELYYYNARYYDPELGRFIQADDIVQSPFDPQSLNRYSYCRNNPINFTDPSGNFWGLFAAIGGFIWGAISAIGGALSAAGGAAVGAAKAVGGALASLGRAAGGFLSGLTSSQAAVSTANSGTLKLIEQGALVGAEGQAGGFLKFGYDAAAAASTVSAGSSSAAKVGSIVGQILGGAVDSLFGAQAAWAGTNADRSNQKNATTTISPGKARIGTRPLESWKGKPFNGTWPLVHEQVWYSNEENIGFFNDSVRPIRADVGHSINEYSFNHDQTEYDEVLMRDAVRNVSLTWDTDFRMPWWKWWDWNNCQSYTDALRREYKRLEGVKKEK